MAETAVPIVWDVLKCVADPIKVQLRYLISSKSFTRDLQEEVEKLKFHFDWIQSGTEKARNDLGIVYDNVTKWQASAERTLMEAEGLLGNFEKAAKTCCYRTLPDLNRHYQFSTEAEDKIKNIQRLLQKGGHIKEIYFIGPVQEIKLRDDGVFESRASILLHIMDALADDSKSVVGVYGMGGVGKSTLLLDVQRIITEQKSFRVVAKADLLGKQDVKSIQEEIASYLQLESVNKNRLRTRLDDEGQTKKVLIILDNLSEKLDLRTVGIPCELDNKVTGCKLLLTSRDRNVLTRHMHCDRDSVFRLPELNEEEAKILFERTAGKKARDDEFKPFVDKALHKCADIKYFFTAGTAPSRSTSDDHVGTQVAFFYGQQVSISSLESLTMKGLPNLKDIWSDESLLGLSNLQSLKLAWCESLLKVIHFGSLANLHKLHTLKVAHCVLVREIFDLAGSSASGNVEIPSKLTTLHLKELPRLSLIWNKNPCGIVRFRYLKQLNVFGCNNLRFIFFSSMVKSLEQLRGLTVQNCKIMEAIIMEEEGLETSETLAFPMLINLCFERLESLTCFFHEKCSREARSQDHVESHSTTLFNGEVAFRRLETLKITGMDNIEMIWDSKVAEDSFPNLKSLSVDECSKLVNIGPSCILQGLRNLEKLEAKACDSVESVFKLQPLNSLDETYDASSRLKKLELIELPKLKCVWDKELFHRVNLQCSHSVSIFKCESLTSLFPASIAIDLMQLEELEIDACGNEEFIENTSHASHGPALKTMVVHGCNKTEILPLQPENEKPTHKEPPILIRKGINVGSKGGPSRQLSISAISTYFNHLKTLKVSHCDGLSKMFTPAIAKNLKRLTELRISYCKMLTKVISDEGDKEGDVVTFNQLKYMELDGLTGLTCFSSGRCTLEFPLLEDIIVTGCLNMKCFSGGQIEAPKVERVQVLGAAPYWEENLDITIRNMYEEMAMVARVKFMRLSEFPDLIGKWHSKIYPIKSSWQLESLVVDNCPLFIKAIPSTLMLVLDNMRRLQVRDCESLEEILDLKGLEAVGSTLLLPKLQHLDLVNLPNLSRLWNKDLQGTLLFNSLGDLTLYNCSNLRHAFAPLMARCLANLVRMDINECGHIEGVIAEEEGQGSAVEKITFPRLRSMKLECLPNLTSFLSGKNHTLDCPVLEHLIIAHCRKMRSFTWQSLMEIDYGTSSLFTRQVQFRRLESMVVSHMDNLSKIWTDDSQETFTFKHLRKVDVQNCKSLANLFPHLVATSLNQLKELRVESCGLEEIVMRGDDTPHSSTAPVLFPELTSLMLHKMSRLKSFCPNLPTLNWSSLKELRVTHCDKLNMLHFAASKSKSVHRDNRQDLSDKEAHSSLERDFPNLERLLLVNKDIQMIQKGKFPDDIFGKPKALTLACFHDEKAVFPTRFLLERFQNLQSLEVFCSSFEDIFPEEGLVDEEKHSVLENLRELKLSKLDNLKCVWREDYLVSKMLQSINKFEVWDCLSLTTLFPAVTCFKNLTELVVKNLSGLVHLVTVSAVTNLVHLTNLTIIGCEKMKEVMANDTNGEGKVIPLGKLESLTLQHLPNLVCFSSTTSCIFKFPSLFSIEVEECPKMKIFSKRMLSTPKLQYASLFRHKWQGNWEGDLNTTIQALSA